MTVDFPRQVPTSCLRKQSGTSNTGVMVRISPLSVNNGVIHGGSGVPSSSAPSCDGLARQYAEHTHSALPSLPAILPGAGPRTYFRLPVNLST